MKRILAFTLIICALLSFASCGSETVSPAGNVPDEPDVPSTDTDPVQTGVPDDFSFYMIWGVYGISSYYSDTGKLTKTTDTIDGNVDKFVAYVKPDKETTERFYKLLTALDLDSYPAKEYDPGCGYSAPSARLVLSYTADGETHTVETIGHINCDYSKSDNEKGQAFLDAVKEIEKYLTSTPEWEALPDYELLYE